MTISPKNRVWYLSCYSGTGEIIYTQTLYMYKCTRIFWWFRKQVSSSWRLGLCSLHFRCPCSIIKRSYAHEEFIFLTKGNVRVWSSPILNSSCMQKSWVLRISLFQFHLNKRMSPEVNMKMLFSRAVERECHGTADVLDCREHAAYNEWFGLATCIIGRSIVWSPSGSHVILWHASTYHTNI